MTETHLISAIGTPLNEDESLHTVGLEAQLDLQWRSGITGILAAGSMGTMQLLSDQTYADLIQKSAELVNGKGELMVGVGDTSFARTCDRIHLVNQYKVDGVAVLTPYLLKFTQAELVDYFRALADESKAPIYLYDLPQVTGLKVDIPTVLELCSHPNIHGVKCSDSAHETRVLIEALAEINPGFRVIVAQPLLLDMLVRQGVHEHLDGVYALAPEWASAIVHHTRAGEHDLALAYQRDLVSLLNLIRTLGALPVFSALMNARGVPGRFAPRPFKLLPKSKIDALLNDVTVQKLLSGKAVPV